MEVPCGVFLLENDRICFDHAKGEEKTILVISVLNWIELAMEALAGEYIRNYLHVKKFPRVSLVCKLVPVDAIYNYVF